MNCDHFGIIAVLFGSIQLIPHAPPPLPKTVYLHSPLEPGIPNPPPQAKKEKSSFNIIADISPMTKIGV